MKICPVCGAKMSDSNTYCGICGAAVASTSSSNATTSTTTATAVEEEKQSLDAIDNSQSHVNEENLETKDISFTSQVPQTPDYTIESFDNEEKLATPPLREVTVKDSQETKDFESGYINPIGDDYSVTTNDKSGMEKFKDGCTNVVFKIKDFFINTNDITETMDETDVEKNKNLSLLSYLGVLVYYIPMMIKPKSKYLRFHGNQGLIFTITSLALIIINCVLCLIFGAVFADTVLGIRTTNGFGVFLMGLFSTVIYGVIIVWTAVGIYNAITGKARELPIIGKFKLLK